MANGVKEYKIVINGVQESINAVDSLNKQLNALEERINTLNSKGVNVSTPKGGGYKGELDAQEKLEKQILDTEEKLAQVRDENYKKLLHMKEELKEYTQIAKSQAAAESNAQGIYDTSTMAGMKAQLKSIKAEMQTVEIGGDRFKELVAQANELNNKLKEIETSYGQYGRNVGNYANSIAEGIEKLKIDINGVTQEFDTAKQAMKTLRNEMQTLSTKKDMGVISESEEERLKGLIPVVKQLESSIADAGKPMDALLDTMQSVMAIASVGQGLGALFGFDDSEIEKTIQKLVAMQNVMQGLQVLQQQMQSGEGIGGWLAKGNAAIDKFVAGLVGTTTATKAATVATKAFGVALKALGIGLIVVAISELISLYKDWSDAQNKAAEEAEEAAAKIKKAVDDQRNAFVNASVQYENTASRLSHLRTEYMTTNDQLKKTSIIKEASAEFKKLGLSVKSVGDAQRILVNQGDDVIQMLRLQGDAAAIAALRMEAFKKSFNMLLENGYDSNSASILAGSNKQVRDLDSRLDQINSQILKKQKSLGVDTEKAIKSNGKKAVAATKDIEEELNRIRIDTMREGLNKTIAQLEEEKRQRLNKIKSNGQRVAELTKATEELYQRKIEDARRDFAERLEKQEREMWKEIGRIGADAASLASENIVKKSENELDKSIDRLQRKLNKVYSDYAPDYSHISDSVLSNIGNIGAGIRTGQVRGVDGSVIGENTLEFTQTYLDILERIDVEETKIYMERRKYADNGTVKIIDEEALSKVEETISKLKKDLNELLKAQDKDLDIDASFEKTYASTFDQYKKYLEDKIKAEKEAARKSYEIERKRIEDETKLREEQYNKEKYDELNGLHTSKANETNALDNKLKLQEITQKQYNDRLAKIDAKYAELAMNAEIKYAEGSMAFAEEQNKKLEELERKHKQEMLDIDKKYDGEVEKQRKNVYDLYVKDINDANTKIAEQIKTLNEEISRLEGERDRILNNAIELPKADPKELEAAIAPFKEQIEKLKKLKDDFLSRNNVTEEEIEGSIITDWLRGDNYTSYLDKQFMARLGNHLKYYDAVEKAEREHWDTVLREQKTMLKAQADGEKTAANDRLEELKTNLAKQEELELNSVKTEEEKLAVTEKYNKERAAAEANTEALLKQIDEQYKKDSERAEIEHQKNLREIIMRTQDNIIGEFRDFYSKLSNMQSSMPITNAWGIIDLKKTNAQNEQLLNGFSQLAAQIVVEKRELQAKLDRNEISFDDFQQTKRELNDLQTSVASSLEKVEADSKNSFGEFLASINQYIQQLGSSLNQIMSSIWQYQDSLYEHQMNELEKQIDKYEELLEKQEDITREHQEKIDDIEDELATSRGDRRQHLIDQLNAEMEAQRRSLIEQKRIEREEEKLKKKKEKEEEAQRKREHQRQVQQAFISWHLSIANGLATQPFMPVGLAMGALATALGAVQYALVKSQKYADGGVIQGKSHSQGGVKVLGGRAEVEGNEFITNKVTTQKNTDLLYYINSKKKRLDINDFIEFYSGKQGKKAISQMSPRNKFADGGVMSPVLDDSVKVDNRILNALEHYAERPYFVTVTDIENKMDDVKYVRTLAGVEQ